MRMHGLGLLAAAGALGAVLALPRGIAAEPQRVEVVGSYPIRDALRSRVNPRDEAIQMALWEGVSRVALELIGEEGVDGEAPDADAIDGTEGASGAAPGSADATERFRKIFGKQILPYTRSFRIVEDRGERPVLFADEPGVRSEYLVVVEVLVDVDRVASELARAGLVAEATGAPAARESVTIELIGLDRYAGLQVALETFRRELAVGRIETLEFAPSRQLLRVSGAFGPEQLAARMTRLASTELVLDPVEVDREGRRLRVMARWAPPAEPEAPPTDGAVPGSATPLPR